MAEFTYYPEATVVFDSAGLCLFDDTTQLELLADGNIEFSFDPWMISFTPGEIGTLFNEDTGETLFDETTLETLIAEPAT